MNLINKHININSEYSSNVSKHQSLASRISQILSAPLVLTVAVASIALTTVPAHAAKECQDSVDVNSGWTGLTRYLWSDESSCISNILPDSYYNNDLEGLDLGDGGHFVAAHPSMANIDPMKLRVFQDMEARTILSAVCENSSAGLIEIIGDPNGSNVWTVSLANTGSCDLTVTFDLSTDGSNLNTFTGTVTRRDRDMEEVYDLTNGVLSGAVWGQPQVPSAAIACANPTITASESGLIYGTDGDDIIQGTDGDDTIYGGLGNDIICAGDGNDFVYGEEHEDTIYGQGGDDQIWGGSQDDKLYDFAGAKNKLNGGGENDLIILGGGNDVARGGGGNDTMWGGSGNDSLQGQGGNDRIYGEAGNDKLYGNAGDDYLDGGADTDGSKAHSGNDTCRNLEKTNSCEDTQ